MPGLAALNSRRKGAGARRSDELLEHELCEEVTVQERVEPLGLAGSPLHSVSGSSVHHIQASVGQGSKETV